MGYVEDLFNNPFAFINGITQGISVVQNQVKDAAYSYVPTPGDWTPSINPSLTLNIDTNPLMYGLIALGVVYALK